jgi:hypothetical protein
VSADYLPLQSPRGRLVVAATVLGSGAVFLEMTVVNVALPSMARDLDLGIAGLRSATPAGGWRIRRTTTRTTASRAMLRRSA